MIRRVWIWASVFIVSVVSTPALAQIFTPEDESYAAFGLRRIFGCVVDGFWVTKGRTASSSCGADDTLVASVIGYFNIGCLVFASIVATYTIYSLVADTANDGEVLGRSSDTKYTFLRSGIGIALALPVSNGFSVIQLLLVQLVIWSIGFGDTTWSFVAERFVTASARSLNTGNFDKVSADSALFQTVSTALKNRIEGHVCAIRLQEIGRVMGGTNVGVTPATANKTSDVTLYFQGGAYYNNSRALCGNVFFSKAPVARSSLTDGVQGNMETAIVAATGDAVNSALTEGLRLINVEAQRIAGLVVSQQRNAAGLSAEIASGYDRIIAGIEARANERINARLSAVSTSVTRALTESTKRGWMLSVLYQRIIANAYGAIAGISSTLSFGSTEPDSLQSYFGGFSSLWNSGTIRPVVDAYERDRAFLDTLDGTFASLAQRSGVEGFGTDNVTPNLGIAGGGYIFEKVLYVLDALKPQASNYEWRDPIPDIQRVGNTVGGVALLFGVGSAATVFVPGGAGNFVSAITTPVFYFMAALAFLLGGVIPLLPLIYFTGAAINWIILVLEAMVAAPLFLLTYFFPAREGSLVGASRSGIVLIVGVLMRPVLIIIGLVAAMLIMRIGTDFIYLIFSNALGSVGQASGMGTVGNLFLTLGIIVMFTVSVLYIVTQSCGLITELGDAVMRWLDNNVGSLFNKNALGDTIGGTMANPNRMQGTLGSVGGMRQAGLTARSTYRQMKEEK